MGSLLCVAGSGIFYIMPAYVSGATRLYHLTDQQAGLLSGAESLAIGLSGALASLQIRRIGWRALAAAALCCALGDLLSRFAGGLGSLLSIRVATGLAGEGLLYACSYSVLGLARRPDRAFGCALVASVLVGAAVIAAQSRLDALGPVGVLAPLAAASLALIPALAWLPRMGGHGPPAASAPGQTGRRGRRLLLAIAVWFGAPGLFWALAGNIGAARGVPAPAVDQALALATLVGLVGLGIPVVLEDRFGRVAPVIIATAAVIAAAVLSVVARDAAGFSIALSLFYVGWNLASVYQLAALAKSDPTGRYAGLAAAAQLAGLSLGPPVGGAMMDGLGSVGAPLGVALFAGAGALILIAARPRRP